MSVIATAIKFMKAGGMSEADILEAVIALEAEVEFMRSPYDTDTAAARRRAYDRERMRVKREVRRQSADSPPTKNVPPDPPKEITLPPELPSGVSPPRRREPRRKPRTPIPDDFPMTEARYGMAAKHGLTRSEADRSHAKFVGRAKADGTLWANWDQALDNWFRKEAEFLGKKPPGDDKPQAGSNLIHIMAISAEWPVYAERWRREKGKDPPVDSKGGWWFPDPMAAVVR